MGKASRKKEQPRELILPSQTLPPSPVTRWGQPWIALLLLALLCALIYSNTFSASFHWDDFQNIMDSRQIRNLSSIPFSQSRYVGFLSFALNYHFDRYNVFGYHLVNLVIHTINSFLVYFFVLLLLRIPQPSLTPHASPLTPRSSRLTNASGIALATALLFVVHPIQTEAVTYIVQRITTLSTLFYLLAAVLYLKWRLAAPESRHRSLWYAGALLSTILAMKTKEISFTLPLMLLLIEAVFFGSLTRKQWMALIPFLITLLIIPLSHKGTIGEAEVGFAKGTTEISRLDYLFTQFNVIMTYLRLLILPVNQNLDYDYPIAHSFLEPKVLFSFLFLLALFTFSLYLLFVRPRPSYPSLLTPHASRLVAFGILWFFLTLSIESSIIPIQDVIFEHRLYLPSVGFFLAGSVLIITLLDRWRWMSALVIGALVMMLSIATYQRNMIWKDDLTLWTDVVRKSPNKVRGHHNMAVAYQELGRLDKAIVEYKTALSLKPDDADAHMNLGLGYQDLGRVDEARQEFKTALALKPDDADFHNHVGTVFQKQGHLEEAMQEYKTAVALKSDFAEAHNNLGLVYQKQGHLEEAMQEYKTAMALKPDYADPHNNLGVVYQKLRRPDDAIREYKAALALEPDDAEPRYNLGLAYFEEGRLPDALAMFKEAIQLKADYFSAHNSLGGVYYKLGRLEEASREYQIALKLKPDFVEAHYNLGQAYQRQGRNQEAIYEFEQALRLNPDYEPARRALTSLRR